MTPDIFILSGVTAAVAGYLVGWFGHGEHRKGCNECDAHIRQQAERQRELQHDYAHKTGMGCDDEECPRNLRRR